MKRATQSGLALLLAAATLSAQNAPPRSDAEQSSKNTVIFWPESTCPVSMHALQGAGSGLVAVRNAEDQRTGPSQRIHLILANQRDDSKAKAVVGAKIVVSGLSGKSRITRTSSGRDYSNSVTRTVSASFEQEGENGVATDLVLPGFTSVTSLRLESLTYRDGTTWAVAGREACHVAPDPLMLIADR